MRTIPVITDGRPQRCPSRRAPRVQVNAAILGSGRNSPPSDLGPTPTDLGPISDSGEMVSPDANQGGSTMVDGRLVKLIAACLEL
jgi:hypothetical protein